MTDRARRIACVVGLTACLLYACGLLLAGTLVAWLAGEADTAAGTGAVMVSTIVGTPVAAWLTRRRLYRAVELMVGRDGTSDGGDR